MRPTLNPNPGTDKSDKCLIYKWNYKPQRGDVVCVRQVFLNPIFTLFQISYEARRISDQAGNRTRRRFHQSPFFCTFENRASASRYQTKV